MSNQTTVKTVERKPELPLLQTRKFKTRMGDRGCVQESYGNRYLSTVIIPEGRTAEDYAAALNLKSNSCHLRFHVENGEVIEDCYCSIGD